MPIPKLRPYQTAPAAAILRSVREHAGLTFTVEMSRQAGKNELSAQLELMLLASHHETGGQIVKGQPTWRPQGITSLRRLRDRLRAAQLPYHTEHGYILRLGNAAAIFLGAGETSNVVGNTASLLLEIDEAQDVAPDKYSKDFRPMGASTNATTVLYGTAWTNEDLLEQTRLQCAALEAQDGIQRNFYYPWDAVAEHNPLYRQYVENERARLGETHPLFQTQYALKPLAQRGRMLTLQQLDLLRGAFPIQSDPRPGDVHVGAIDVAGAAEATGDDLTTRQGRDSTVLSIGALRDGRLDLVASYSWTDVPHHTTLLQVGRLFAHWRLQHLVVDATGAGEPYAQALARQLGATRVTPFTFSAASKSELAYALLARINRGHLQIAAGAPQDLWDQLRLARLQARPTRQINFYVDDRDGHDDYLMSVALLCHAADTLPAPRVASGR